MTTTTLKTDGGLAVEVIESTVRDVKPAGVGYIDESWFVAQCPDGRWVTLSDAVDQAPEYHDSEEDAEAKWGAAAEAHRSVCGE